MNSQLIDARFLHVYECMRANDLDTALALLVQARSDFAGQSNVVGELRSILLLAQVYHRREDLGTARMYTEEAANLLTELPILDIMSRADIYLGLARLSPDIGQLAQGFQYAQQSLQLYKEMGAYRGQYDAHILCKMCAQQQGHNQIAQTHLEAANQLAKLLQLGEPEQTFLLNTRAHTCWYRGDFSAGLSIAGEGIALADRVGPAKFRVYIRLLLANILRARQEFTAAEAMYRETANVANEMDFSLFLIWIESNRAWLDALQGRYNQARHRLYVALETADKGQSMSFNVFLAGVFALTGRFREAEDLLNDSLHFYMASGDELSVFAIRIHLAHTFLKTDMITSCEEHLTLALAWANEWNVDFFPNWWHPTIVAEACIHALIVGISPSIAERILVKRVENQAIPLLQNLLTHQIPEVRQRAADALSFLNKMPMSQITATDDELVHLTLVDLMTDGVLQETHLSRLAQLLSTSRQQTTSNSAMLATFGLYIQGMTRSQIARRLNRSENTIRNHITHIYDCFGLVDKGSRTGRRQRLVNQARTEGFVGSW